VSDFDNMAIGTRFSVACFSSKCGDRVTGHYIIPLIMPTGIYCFCAGCNCVKRYETEDLDEYQRKGYANPPKETK